MADAIEATLLVVRECFVYKIPPRAQSRGYRAAEWDVNQFLWKGRLRVVTVNDQCIVRLEDVQSGELFAQCFYDPSTNSVEQVLDSSRYFVLRVEDNGRHAFIGLGFQERTDAFDFNVALQDHAKYLKQQQDRKNGIATNVSAAPALDLSLKQGETLNLNLAIGGKPATTRTREQDLVDSNGSFALLPPPPPVSRPKPIGSNAMTSSNNAAGDDLFGSFASAPSNGQAPSGWTTFG